MFLDAHRRYKLYLSGPGFSFFICSVIVQQFNFEDFMLDTVSQKGRAQNHHASVPPLLLPLTNIMVKSLQYAGNTCYIDLTEE